MQEYLKPYLVDLPEGSVGSWKIEHFTIDINDAETRLFNLRQVMSGYGRRVESGDYTKLTRNGATIMSDTGAEMHDHMSAMRMIDKHGGRVLINGLGLGMVLKHALAQDNVEHVDVVEKSWEVIKLVGEHYLGEGWTRNFRTDGFGGKGKEHYVSNSADGRLTIWQDDAFDIKWPRGMRWNTAWHDIWDEINPDNLAGMGTLNRRYGRRVDWQGAWCQEMIRRVRDGW